MSDEWLTTSHSSVVEGGLDQAVANSESRGCGPVVNSNLIEDMGEMIGDRFLAESQLLSNLAVAFAGGDEPEHVHFALAKAGRERRLGAGTWLRGQAAQSVPETALFASKTELLEEGHSFA